jgi:O-antigen/teichoic acid export membrane protein
LGLYGRAYQLISMPTDYLNGAIGSVAFSALSRIQEEPAKLKRYFLKGYSLTVSITVPITVFCGLFADQIILIALGPEWSDAAEVFRLLAPTVLVFAIINPFSWLLLSLGLQGRSLKVSLVLAPIVMGAYCVGLPFGPNGVALAYSTAMVLWATPHILWCIKGTGISFGDIAQALRQPLLAGAVAALGAWFLDEVLDAQLGQYGRLIIGGAAMVGLYFLFLLIIFGQKAVYIDLAKGLRGAIFGGVESKASTP